MNEWRVSPFHLTHWHGRYVSLDGAPDKPFTQADVAEVLYDGESGDGWDGTVAAVMRLKDGRYVAFETFYGPTGDGFCEDAYGGDADLLFATDLNTVVMLGLTDAGRRLCGIPVEGFASSEGTPTPSKEDG